MSKSVKKYGYFLKIEKNQYMDIGLVNEKRKIQVPRALWDREDYKDGDIVQVTVTNDDNIARELEFIGPSLEFKLYGKVTDVKCYKGRFEYEAKIPQLPPNSRGRTFIMESSVKFDGKALLKSGLRANEFSKGQTILMVVCRHAGAELSAQNVTDEFVQRGFGQWVVRKAEAAAQRPDRSPPPPYSVAPPPYSVVPPPSASVQTLHDGGRISQLENVDSSTAATPHQITATATANTLERYSTTSRATAFKPEKRTTSSELENELKKKTNDDLKKMLKDRGLPSSGNKSDLIERLLEDVRKKLKEETMKLLTELRLPDFSSELQDNLIELLLATGSTSYEGSKLREELQKKTNDDLKKMLKDRGLPSSGNKPDLINRLLVAVREKLKKEAVKLLTELGLPDSSSELQDGLTRCLVHGITAASTSDADVQRLGASLKSSGLSDRTQ